LALTHGVPVAGAIVATGSLETITRDDGRFELAGAPTGWIDLVVVADFPDDETGTAVALQLASTGSLRSVTMRAFTEGEMTGIIEKMG